MAAVTRSSHISVLSILTAAAALLAVLLLPAGAAAHTDFDGSTPGDGSTVEGPLEQIRLVFSIEATEAGEGFVVLDPERGRIRPDRVENPRTGVFLLQFDRPLNPGRVGVRWSVRAPDAHPISGSFSFQIQPSQEPPAGAGSTGAGAAPPPAAKRPPASGAGGSGAGEKPPEPSADKSATYDQEIEEFLATGQGSSAGSAIARTGRGIAFLGLAMAIGLTVFAGAIFSGSRRELARLIGLIRLGGLVIVLGTLIDAAGQVMVDASSASAVFEPSAWERSWNESLGVAWLIRIAGGLMVALGARAEIAHPRGESDPLVRLIERVPGASAAPQVVRDARPSRSRLELRLDPSTALIGTGIAMLLLSAHAFDGHTVNEGNRFATGAAAAIHVLAGSIWAGGIGGLAWAVSSRRRRRETSDALLLLARFSVVAGIALVLVAVAGVYLTIVILDSPSGLWQSDWGKLLLLKLGVVAGAAGVGAYNHFRVIPELEMRGGRGSAAISRSLTLEAAAMLTIIALTALLVRASSIPT